MEKPVLKFMSTMFEEIIESGSKVEVLLTMFLFYGLAISPLVFFLVWLDGESKSASKAVTEILWWFCVMFTSMGVGLIAIDFYFSYTYPFSMIRP